MTRSTKETNTPKVQSKNEKKIFHFQKPDKKKTKCQKQQIHGKSRNSMNYSYKPKKELKFKIRLKSL